MNLVSIDGLATNLSEIFDSVLVAKQPTFEKTTARITEQVKNGTKPKVESLDIVALLGIVHELDLMRHICCHSDAC